MVRRLDLSGIGSVIDVTQNISAITEIYIKFLRGD